MGCAAVRAPREGVAPAGAPPGVGRIRALRGLRGREGLVFTLSVSTQGRRRGAFCFVYSCHMLRPTTAAMLLIVAVVLAGCGGTNSAAPLSCLRAAGLPSAKAYGSTSWGAILPGTHSKNVRYPNIFVNRYPTAAQAAGQGGGPGNLAPLYSLAVDRYAVAISLGAPIRDRHFVHAVASCLRGVHH